MRVSLATPEKVVFEGEVKDLLLEAERGQINLLEDHANYITLVKPGLLTAVGDSGKNSFEVMNGILRVRGDEVKILCNEAKAVA